MALKIVTADERLAQPRGIKGLIAGPSKIGKTSLLWTLDPETTLAVDFEAGMLSVQDWPGASIPVRTWEEARDLICWLGGPNPAMRADQAYSQAHFDHVARTHGDPAELERFRTIFIDSITVAGRLCLQWCKGQPEARNQQGRPDTRGAYGLMGQEMIGWLTHAQHIPGRNVWLVGILEKRQDDFGRPYHALQVDGSKTGLELPGIVDEVIAMTELPGPDGRPYRAFVCQQLNDWGLPAGDRSGRLDMVEEPHLGRLMQKILGPVRPAEERLGYDMPAETGP